MGFFFLYIYYYSVKTKTKNPIAIFAKSFSSVTWTGRLNGYFIGNIQIQTSFRTVYTRRYTYCYYFFLFFSIRPRSCTTYILLYSLGRSVHTRGFWNFAPRVLRDGRTPHVILAYSFEYHVFVLRYYAACISVLFTLFVFDTSVFLFI